MTDHITKSAFSPHEILEENTCDHAPFSEICGDCRALISAALEHLENERERLTNGMRERIESWRKNPVDERYYSYSGVERHFCADDLEEVLNV